MVITSGEVDRRSAGLWLGTGSALVLGGLLLGAALLLIVLLPYPPTGSEAIARWASVHDTPLTWSDELLFFAVVCLLPAVLVIFDAAKARHTLAVSVSCAALSLGLITLIGLITVIGRLIYPVFGIELSADIVALLVSLIFGVLHAVLLFFAVGLIAAAVAMRGGRAPRWMVFAGYVIGAAQIAASFPWLTPTWWNATTTLALTAAAIVTGAYLIATRRSAPQRAG